MAIRYRMRVDALPAQAVLPPSGVIWQPFSAAQHARQARDLLNAAYRDGGGEVDGFETWWPRLFADSEFEATLCFVAIAEKDDTLAGFAQCWTSAFVKDMAVAETWRRRGLGGALMQRVFQTFQARGADHVDLKVEAGNPHGAEAFYQSLGMQPVDGAH